MKFTLASISLLLAGLASAEASSSATPTPSSASYSYSYSYHAPSFTFPPNSVIESRYSAIPTKSWSSIAAAGSSMAASELNTKDFDCVYQDYGCDWMRSIYNGTHCGYSPYKAGHTLNDGSVIMAVSKNGTGDCASQAGNQCCKALARDPCKYGEKYLECHQA